MKSYHRLALAGAVLALLLAGCSAGPITAGWAGMTVEGSNLYAAYRENVYAFTGSETPITYGQGDAVDPAWSPDGDRFAYARLVDDHYQLFLQTQGGDAQQLTDAPANHRTPAFSPEGNHIVYASKGDLYILDLNDLESAPFQLTDTDFAESNPDWSPDNERIVYTADEDGSTDLYIISSDGTETTRLTTTTASESGPRWSPDGSLIAYAADLDGNNDIYLINDRGEDRTQITEDPADDRSPSWSAKDGAYLLFTSNRGEAGYDLYTVVARAGAAPEAVASTELSEMAPHWQPGEEGKQSGWMLYQAEDDTGSTQIYRTRADQSASVAGVPTWTFPTEPDPRTQYYAPPTVVGDRLYVGGYDRRLHALSLSDGTPILSEACGTDDEGNPLPWVTEQLEDVIVNSVAVGDGMIYVPIANRNVLAFSTECPEMLWTFKTGHGVWAKPLLVEDTLYVASLDHHVYAVQAESGEEIWRSDDLNGAIPAQPIYDAEHGQLYAGTLNSQFYALDVETGEIVHTFDAEDWVWGSPALHGGVLYFGDMSGWLYALDADGWELLWKERVTEEGGVRGSPVVTQDRIYVTATDGYLRAREREDGANIWRAPQGDAAGPIYSMPTLMGGLVIVSPMGGESHIVAFDAEEGTQVWRYPTNGESQ